MNQDSTTIVAEAGMNHDGSLGNAKRMVDVADECGVDAVKFQTHISEAETLPDAPTPPYFDGEPRYEYFERTAFDEDEWRDLKAHCEKQGVEFQSSPFSIEAVELLDRIGMERFKIPSGEVTNLPMLERIAETGKPVILSSGMSSWDELDRAVETIREYHDDLIVLQCTSKYPCPPDEVGLNVMDEIRERYDVPTGLSDHTLPNYAAFAAVTKGATLIEKHFTLSQHMYGSDAEHSLEPEDLADLVDGIRTIETILDNPVHKDEAVDQFDQMKTVFEKSLVAARSIDAGERLTRKDLTIKKPGTGIPAAKLDDVVGTKAAQDIPAETLLEDTHLEDSL